ncbi:TPA: hypothetical protein HA318_01465 [Candidatus Micrarchaeota archaeon]|nr:hypothetical protein [Candidatus Micrarchaeota archaeon]
MLKKISINAKCSQIRVRETTLQLNGFEHGDAKLNSFLTKIIKGQLVQNHADYGWKK